MSTLIARLRSLWRSVGRRAELDAGMDEEFRLHRDLYAEDLIRAGLHPREAARRANLAFGGADRYREEARAERGLASFDALLRDARYAGRSLRRTPGFLAAAVLTLALGVGANAAVFSLVSASLFRPLPFPDPDRLVVLHQTFAPSDGEPYALPWSYGEYAAVRSALGTLADVAGYASAAVNLSDGGDAVRASAEIVSTSYFRTLGVRPLHGRDFVTDDDRAGGAGATAIIGHDLWHRYFAADPDLAAQRLVVNGSPVTIVGVAPRGFHGLTGVAEVWLPHAAGPTAYFSGYLTTSERFISVIGRLAPGASFERARAEVAAAGLRAAALARAAYGAGGGGGMDASGAGGADAWTAEVIPLDTARRDPAAARALLVLAGAVFFVLCIAVVNLFALLLARGTARARETAVRGALGAGRLRLVRHGAVEGGLIGVLGGAAGVLLAVWAVRLLAMLAPADGVRTGSRMADVATFAEPAVDWRVIAFSAAVSLAAGVLAGVLPALRGTRGDLLPALRTGARGASVGVGSVRRPTVLSAAAVVQVACALVLLTGAGALLQAFERLRSIDPGFDGANVVTFRITPPDRVYGGDAAAPLLERVLERVAGVPGVRAATVSLCAPYSQCSHTPLYITGAIAPDVPPPSVGRHYVGPDHFSTLGIPLLRGRALTDADRAGSPLVAVINETAARRFWPGEDPIGQRVRFGGGGAFATPDSHTEIVGVVGDVLYDSPGGTVRPDFYTSYRQFTWPHTTVLVRADGDFVTLVPALRRAVLDVDPHLPIHDVRTMRQHRAGAVADERFATLTLTGFAVLGLLLASLGVYGIMAYSVTQRRMEIGIRLALGSTPGDVLRVILAQGAALTAAGLTAGAALALVLGRALPALIAGVGAAQPALLAGVATVMSLVALAACYLPARAAMRVDPVETLASD